MSHNVSMYSHNTGGPLLNIREVAKSSSTNKPTETAEATTPLPSLIEQDEEQSTLTSRTGQEFLKTAQNGSEQQRANEPSQTGPGSDAQKNANENVNDILTHPSPMVSMVSKHANGTLNLWQLTFADKTKFSQVSEYT